jgi:hypothetical protein
LKYQQKIGKTAKITSGTSATQENQPLIQDEQASGFSL